MSSRDRDRDDRLWQRMIFERQQRLERLLDSLSSREAHVEVSAEMKRELAAAISDLHRQLIKYDGEAVLGDAGIPDIGPINQRLGQTTRQLVESGRRGGDYTYREAPAVDELSIAYLKETANAVQAAARSLGFWAHLSASEQGGSQLPKVSRIQADSPEDVGSGSGEAAAAADFEQSHFFRSLYKDVEGQRGGGAIVIVDAEDARTGVGKTGAACAMAEFVGWYFDYELQERDGVLSGQEYLDLFKQHPNEEQVSVCVWDEAVGAGSGDARRAMAQENVDLGRAWQLMRDRRVITFVTLPDWGDLDSRLQKLADYRVWCRRDIGSMQAYEIGTTFEGGDIRTRGLGPGEGAEPIAFPDVTDDSELYQSIKAKKDKVQETDSLSADELRDEEDGEEESNENEDKNLEEIVDEVVEDIDSFKSFHEAHKNYYIDKGLIRREFDLSHNDAKDVKTFVKQEVGEL